MNQSKLTSGGSQIASQDTINKMNTLAIAYATDNGYAQHVAVSLYSLFSSAKSSDRYKIYILDNNLAEFHRNNLIETARYFNQELSFIDISDIGSRLPSDIDTANLSISTYCRLFVAQLLPVDIEKVLYLDCDTYINDDLMEITEYLPANDDWYVAGVEDTMYPHMKEGIGLSRDALYINAGVLLINLSKWRGDNVLDRFLDFIKLHDGAVPHLDQGVINGVFKNGKIRLPLRYNVQSPIFAFHKREDLLRFFSLSNFYDSNAVSLARKNPAIIHYTSFFLERPWFRFSIHPYKKLYRNTLQLTPYSHAELLHNNISFKGKIKDLSFKYLQPLYLKLR